jgi:hypothetical protein
VSPSGTGVKLFAEGQVPPGGNRRGKIEFYSRGRYFTVTGQRLDGSSATVEARQAELEKLHAEVFKPPAPRSRPFKDRAADGALDDAALLHKAMGEKNGARFAALWMGDTSGHGGDASAADLALCAKLAFYTGPDPARIDHLFRQSGLMRPKWDETHYSDGRTYGQATIHKALEGRTEFYGGQRNGKAESTPGVVQPTDRSGEHADRPAIIVTTEEHEVNAEAVAALTRDDSLYQRGGMLVRIVRDVSPAAKGIRRPFAPRIELLPPALLRERLAACARWFTIQETKEGIVEKPARPPTWCVAAVHARADWPGIRHLEAVVDYPVLRPDGTLLSQPGYDPETGLLLESTAEFPAIPDQPSRSDALAAAEPAERCRRLRAGVPRPDRRRPGYALRDGNGDRLSGRRAGQPTAGGLRLGRRGAGRHRSGRLREEPPGSDAAFAPRPGRGPPRLSGRQARGPAGLARQLGR